MDYIEFKIELKPTIPAKDILTYHLAESGFESFTDGSNGFNAYCPLNLYKEEEVQNILIAAKEYAEEITFSKKVIKQQNWNEVWESNFVPIEIDTRCLVRAPFHNVDKTFDHEIVINPKMSFGTGHHETTFLMLSEMLEMSIEDKSILDMGCGTGILAILASKLKANTIDAIDIEEWAYENTLENALVNKCDSIEAFFGDADLLSDKEMKYDIVIANINRNILLNDMTVYAKSMKEKSEILFSGFYEVDATLIEEEASKYNLKLKNKRIKNDWCMLHFER